MVDLLGRSGLVKEAEALMLNLPFKPDEVLGSSLLGAFKLHGNLQTGMSIAECLYADELWNSSNYVLLANLHASIDGWNEASEVRENMDSKEVQRNVGCSWIEIGSCMHSFYSK